MPVRRRQFFGNDPSNGGGMMMPQGGSSQPSPHPMPGGGQMPAPPPPPTDPMQAGRPGYGRGPVMPGHINDLLTPQQEPDPKMDDNPMAGSSSVVLRLLSQLGKL